MRRRSVVIGAALALLWALLLSPGASIPAASQTVGFPIYVIDYGAGSGGTLFAVDSATGFRTTISAGGGFYFASGVVAAPTGGFYVSNLVQTPVLWHVAMNGVQTSVATGFTNPEGLAMDSGGMVLVADSEGGFGPGKLWRVNPSNGSKMVLSSAGVFDEPVDVAVTQTGLIYVADRGSGGVPSKIIRVDPVNGAQTTIATGANLAGASGLSEGPDGNLYVAAINKIVRVNPANGAQTVVASGGNLVIARDVIFGPDGQMYVADEEGANGFGALVRIDPSNGAQTVLAAGLPFASPTKLALGPGANAAPGFGKPSCGAATFVPVIGSASLGATVEVSASDTDAGQTVTVAATGLPAYATFSGTPGNPATGRIVANPTVLDWLTGLLAPPTSVVTLTATDNGSPPATAACQITLRVRLATGSPI